MSKRIDEKREIKETLEEMEDDYTIDASYMQDLRDWCIKECETMEVYATKYEHDGEGDRAQKYHGMSYAYGTVAEEIADKLSLLGIPWSRK